MATKAQLINFIIEKFQQPDGEPVSKPKLDSLKKADLEEFIREKGLEEELKIWLSSSN